MRPRAWERATARRSCVQKGAARRPGARSQASQPSRQSTKPKPYCFSLFPGASTRRCRRRPLGLHTRLSVGCNAISTSSLAHRSKAGQRAPVASAHLRWSVVFRRALRTVRGEFRVRLIVRGLLALLSHQAESWRSRGNAPSLPVDVMDKADAVQSRLRLFPPGRIIFYCQAAAVLSLFSQNPDGHPVVAGWGLITSCRVLCVNRNGRVMSEHAELKATRRDLPRARAEPGVAQAGCRSPRPLGSPAIPILLGVRGWAHPPGLRRSSGGIAEADHLSPVGATLHKQLSSHSRRGAIAPDPEVITDGAKRTQESLGVLGRFETGA
jgi:hypothetical protein